MDVVKETSLIVQALSSTQITVLTQTGKNSTLCSGSRELRDNLKLYAATDATFPPSVAAPEVSSQRQHLDCRQAAAPAVKERCLPNSASPQSLADVSQRPAQVSSTHAISLTSSVAKGVSPWSQPEDCNGAPFALMEPVGVSALSEDCLIQQSRTCLGCFIEPKDGDAGMSLKISDVSREYESCGMSDMGMQCMGTGETGHYGEQLLSDQLLSFPVSKSQLAEKKEAEKADNDSDDPASKNLYEGLLLDKCSGEEALLANTNQDWGYFESFITESKMELLDLCSKNELSVNLFSEEDVDNYMFDDDDDSTLSSDVCSLKIRYESFQDNMREKTNVLQEETQFNFFPSVVVNCTRKEGGVVKKNDDLQPKAEELVLLENDAKGDQNDSSADQFPDYSPKMNYFIDFSNSTEDSEEYSDDSSSCTGSSFDAFQDSKHRNSFSRKNVSSSNHLNYGLRAKRKVRYSEDYLYDVDSIDSEKNTEKRERPPAGPKEEEDDDWCPKKRRKSPRKETPVIIKYIIINRFKGERHMSVKLGKIDPTVTTVSLNEDTVGAYEKLAPLKDFWQQRQREREEQLKLAAGDKPHFHLNGRHRSFGPSPPKRKHKFANRLRIQRIHTVERPPNKQGFSLSEPGQGGGAGDETGATGSPLTTAACSVRAAESDLNDITHTETQKSRSQEREERTFGSKIVRIRKFKSEARLRSKKMRHLEECGETVTNLTEISPVLENKESAGSGKSTEISSATQSPHLCDNQSADTPEKFPLISATRSPDKGSTSEDMAQNVPVIPGGYLQTLLDASDSSGSTGISYFAQQPARQYSLGLALDEKQFSSLQLPQSCVLSPPSESELQQSPQNCTSFTQMWPPQLCPNQQFATDIPETTVLSNNFPSTLPVPVPVPVSDNLVVSGYSQLSMENRILYEKNYMPEQPLPSDTEFQACQLPCMEGQIQFQRGTLHADNGRLLSLSPAGPLSATSSNYSSQSLKSCEKDGEEDVNENFLAHCSPKLVIQQSTDAITPLRESTDLLDISNFTPDKFRHTSLSELSPPETPNLSPQVRGREMKIVGKAKDFQDRAEMTTDRTTEIKWNCSVMEQQNHPSEYTVDNLQFQLHSFDDEDSLCLDNKEMSQAKREEEAGEMIYGAKGTKSKRKNSSKPTAGQGAKKSSKVPRTAKTEKGKNPRQNSRTSKKIKAMLDGKASKCQAGNSTFPPNHVTENGPEDRPGPGWSEGGGRADDDQREFEEPSNILSNIVSGMAEVQRFMMASVEPTWGPAAGVSFPAEANSLKLKTLKILAGTSHDPKKKGAVSAGGAKGRKAGGKSNKNQAKFNASHPLFPQLALGYSVLDRPSLAVPGITGPAHKKMYRHKTSAKFPRIENLKGKRAERDPNKDIALMASFEKLR
ncbi:neurite extension and migration factor [Chanos chanos]|uniref:Neurite extension and migration factor n=1 Tax=Chanos chanos TaxID=29144 RepID=A0A6J2URR3_CHACN|nr:neurite extension and migration factor [Chanos chanos]